MKLLILLLSKVQKIPLLAPSGLAFCGRKPFDLTVGTLAYAAVRLKERDAELRRNDLAGLLGARQSACNAAVPAVMLLQKPVCQHMSLSPAFGVQRNIALSLNAANDIPIGLSMAYQANQHENSHPFPYF
ncbi:hypothetical protein D3C71_1558650 [compost metagenome]